MTSVINPNNINGDYPVAGVPNNTQGFRDNFTNIKSNFQSAADEITELQDSVLLKAALTGTTLDNNMNDNEIYAARIRDFSGTISQIAATSGSITVDYSQGHYQTISTTGTVSLSFANFPASGSVGIVRVRITINNVAHTVTLPAAVTRGTTGLQGLSGSTITFANTGTYEFAFLSSDGGTNITIFDLNRPLGAYQATTAAVSTTTGAVTVAGGVGIVGNLHVGGQIVGNITVTGVSVVGNVTGGNIVTANGIYGNILSVNNIGAEDSTEVKFITDVTFDDEVSVNGNLTISGNISPASTTKIGGVRAGPGANISNTGLLTIDTANLAFSFGNFTANNNILEIVNSNEDMVLATSGNAEIELVGNIGFYKPNGLPPDTANRYFQATSDGQVTFLVPNTDPVLGAVQIIGSTTGNSVSPAVAGVMLHITGQTDDFASQYIDGVNNFPNYIGRRYNGTADSPTQILSGETIMRLSGVGYTSSGFSAIGASGSLGLVAEEDFTATNQGTKWQFLNIPLGGNTRQEVANITVANGVSATQFNTGNTVSATGNVVGGNINTAGLVSATGNVVGGNINTAGSILSSGTAGVGYVTGAGGTVTQLTSKTTAVTLNKISGEITSNNATISGGSVATFQFNNSTIANTDVMFINQVSAANVGFYGFNANCQNGYANVSIRNTTNSAAADVIVIRYVVIKGAVA